MKQNMQLEEQISALLDNELPEVERDQLLDRILQEPELFAIWERYQQASVLLGAEADRQKNLPGVHFRVSKILAAEPKLIHSTATVHHLDLWRKKIWKPLSGVAVAASVMLMTVFSVQFFMQEESLDKQKANIALSEPMDKSDILPVNMEYSLPENPAVVHQFTDYLPRHATSSIIPASQSLHPYVQVIEYQPGKP